MFNTRQAVQKLRARGFEEPQADAVVEVVEDATKELVTKADLVAANAELRAELYRAFWIFSGIILGGVAGIATIAVTIAGLLFN